MKVGPGRLLRAPTSAFTLDIPIKPTPAHHVMVLGLPLGVLDGHQHLAAALSSTREANWDGGGGRPWL